MSRVTCPHWLRTISSTWPRPVLTLRCSSITPPIPSRHPRARTSLTLCLCALWTLPRQSFATSKRWRPLTTRWPASCTVTAPRFRVQRHVLPPSTGRQPRTHSTLRCSAHPGATMDSENGACCLRTCCVCLRASMRLTSPMKGVCWC